MSDTPTTPSRTCEWCGSPMTHDGRAVCPSCGRLASRLAAMDEPDEPGADAEPEAEAPAPPPPPPPAVPAPPAPAAGTTPEPQRRPGPPPKAPTPAPKPRRRATGDGPVAPGDAWPTPAPLPPDEESRAWWKVALPAAVVVLLVAVGGFLVFGGGDDGGSSEATEAPAPSKSGDKVDLSDIDDPAATTTRPRTTTTTTEAEKTTTTEATDTTTPDGRTVVEAESGVTWSMAVEPDVDDIVSSESPDPVGRSWQTQQRGTTEVVNLTDLGGVDMDVDQAIQTFAETFDGELSAIEDSHIEEAPGRTASFSGELGGTPVVGYVVAAQVGDQSLVVAMFRDGSNLDELYLDWLALPSSFQLP